MRGSMLWRVVDRMLWIDRHPIETDLRIEATQFDEMLPTIVARLTKRLQIAQSEAVPIALVWRDVVSDRGWCGSALL
jgi:hypothetical protein